MYSYRLKPTRRFRQNRNTKQKYKNLFSTFHQCFLFIIQISYASSSPLLSDRFTYPLFFRTYPSENSFNNGHFALMNEYGWCNVAAVHETANIFSLVSTVHVFISTKLMLCLFQLSNY